MSSDYRLSIVDSRKSHVRESVCAIFFCPNSCIYQKKAVPLQRKLCDENYVTKISL